MICNKHNLKEKILLLFQDLHVLLCNLLFVFMAAQDSRVFLWNLRQSRTRWEEALAFVVAVVVGYYVEENNIERSN